MQTKRLSPISLAKLFSVYYAFWGFVYGLTYMLTQKEAWHAPLGFWTLFLAAKLDITFHAQANTLSVIGLLFWAILCFGLTGWISGLIGAVIYNLCPSTFGLQTYGVIEPESQPNGIRIN